MRHLKKFESSDDNLDIEYIKECFVEYLGGHNDFIVDELSDGRKCVDILIILPGIEYSKSEDSFIISNTEEYYKISDKIKSINDSLNFYKDIESCIEKVKIQYNDIEIETSNDREGLTYDNSGFESFIRIHFVLPKIKITKDFEKNKLNFVNFKDLDKSWI